MATFEPAYWHDGFRAPDALWKAIGARADWAEISQDMGATPLRSNWVTPVDIGLRRRILDHDGDGRVDGHDRLYDVGLHAPRENLGKAFTPQEPDEAAHRLRMTTAFATNWLNRGVAGYNESMMKINRHQGVSSAGYFEGAPTDAPVRFFAESYPDGTKGWVMQVNHHFAHMPEEVLRVVAAYQFNQYLAENDESFAFYGKPVEAKVNGLMAAAFTLSHDRSYNDSKVWKQLLEAFNLPKDIKRHDLEHHAEAGYRDFDAGHSAAVTKFLEALSTDHADVREALGADEAGVWGKPALNS